MVCKVQARKACAICLPKMRAEASEIYAGRYCHSNSKSKRNFSEAKNKGGSMKTTRHTVDISEIEPRELSQEIASTYGGGEDKMLKAVANAVLYRVFNHGHMICETPRLDVAVEAYNNAAPRKMIKAET
jgi:hypothetical protein